MYRERGGASGEEGGCTIEKSDAVVSTVECQRWVRGRGTMHERGMEAGERVEAAFGEQRDSS